MNPPADWWRERSADIDRATTGPGPDPIARPLT
jgi:hypothetical protein